MDKDVLWKMGIKTELQDLWEELCDIAITTESYNKSLQFIELLPNNIIPPILCLEGDGMVCFDWLIGYKHILSVFIGGKLLVYAYDWDVQRLSYIEEFTDVIPPGIIRILQNHLLYKTD